ncbi:hypothetical protein B7494_g5533 [Chlorociboria aeruginascens]|nr:hypothetical protein B7494_g5533 [Chlorociboria aeruginascens]
MAAGDPAVIRIPRTDADPNESDFVLLHVTASGPSLLDLRLVSTEGSTVFAFSLQCSQTAKLRAKTCPYTQEEWDGILQSILQGKSEAADLRTGVEAVARLENNGETMIITIQKRIEGITQRLGTLTLPSQEEEVSIFDWCGLALSRSSTLSSALTTLQSQYATQQRTIQTLQSSLEELIKTKNDHENELLEKFALLLNEKKLKIRDQQRLLAVSNVDAKKLAEVENLPSSSKNRTAEASRAGKRKAVEVQQESGSEDEGFERMNIDNNNDNDAEEALVSEEEAQTPDPSTASDTQSDIEDEAPAASSASNISHTVKSTGGSQRESASSVTYRQYRQQTRDLPGKEVAVKKADPGSETESDDDEL